MRVVLDTVILVRGLINPFSLWGRVIFDFAGRYRWLVSPAVADEYVDVLNRPELVRKYRTVATRDLDTVLGNLATALVVEPSATPAVCRDPEDDKLLAAALAGTAQFIVSEDLDLLDLGSYEGIQIATAAAFLRTLEAQVGPMA